MELVSVVTAMNECSCDRKKRMAQLWEALEKNRGGEEEKKQGLEMEESSQPPTVS